MQCVGRLTGLVLAVATAAALVGLPAAAETTGEDCAPPLAVVSASTPIGFGGCPGVRPGAMIRIPRPDIGENSQVACTLNFFFMGTDSRGGTHAYMGTAGHCILGESSVVQDVGERTWPLGEGPAVLDARGDRIGEFAYAVMEDGRDFALVRIYGGVAASPQMCHFGGPTGINDDLVNRTTLLRHYGHGLAVSTVTPARTAVATSLSDPNRVRATGAANLGDSGGPVTTTDGRAVGVLTDLGFQGARTRGLSVDTGAIGITRLRPQLNRAAQVLNQIIRVQTAELR